MNSSHSIRCASHAEAQVLYTLAAQPAGDYTLHASLQPVNLHIPVVV